MKTVEIETTAGSVRGIEAADVCAFKGIPYGADTSNEGRFRPPRPAPPWSGVRDCSEYGPSCPQMTVEQMLGITLPPGSESFMGTQNYERVVGEDCLVLNVWTPVAPTSAARPVLAWLHGGGWSTGSASWLLYDFANLARNGDVVVVGINHRVGVLGFLDVSRFGEGFADSGNVGMLDVVAALEWIRDNIAGFGGDPHNVTVFGESGGGAKVSTLLAMPAAQGLLHKAMAMSGAMLDAQLPDDAAVDVDAVLDHLGVGVDVEKLQAVETARLVDAEVALPGRLPRSALEAGRGLSPVLCPSLPRHPGDALRAGLGADVALVSGCNRDETIGFLFADPDLWTLGIDRVMERLLPLLGEETDRVVAAFREARPDDSPTSLLIAVSTDAIFRIPQIRLAEAHVEGGGISTHMYLYTFGHHTDPMGSVRAPHGTDMPYFFDNIDKAPMAAGPHAEALVSTMSGALVSLARTGAPGHAALPTWPPYTLDQRATMRFDVPARVDDDPLGAERRCWTGIDLAGLQGS